MTAAVVNVSAATPGADVFDLDVRVETERVRPDLTACSTDDGCGSTCEISACTSSP